MGFLKSCLDLLFHVATTPFSSFEDFFSDQHPLVLPDVDVHGSSGFNRPHYPSLDPRTCRYPGLEKIGYRRCTDKSKSCWLSRSGYKSYDVSTDCTFWRSVGRL